MWLNGPSQLADGLPLELHKRQYVLGRDKDCHVVIRDLSVSRRHARITPLHSGTAEIEDLKSRNGTYVNDVRIGKATVQVGDRVTLGVVEFVLAGSPLSTNESAHEGVSTARVRRDPDSLAAAVQKLTPAQRNVFQLLLDGLDENQIAGRCGCRPRTAHNHIQAIYRALDVHSRQQLLARFVGATSFFGESAE